MPQPHPEWDPGIQSSTVTSSLSGIWAGKVEADHPGFWGPQIEDLTMAFYDDGRLRFFKFGEFMMEGNFGTPPGEMPLSGSAVAHVFRDDGFLVRVTVNEAEWNDTGFTFEYRIQDTADTPPTDLTTRLVGTLQGDRLHVVYDASGPLYTAPLTAHAEGQLRPQ